MKKRLLALLYTPLIWGLLALYFCLILLYFFVIAILYPVLAITGQVKIDGTKIDVKWGKKGKENETNE